MRGRCSTHWPDVGALGIGTPMALHWNDRAPRARCRVAVSRADEAATRTVHVLGFYYDSLATVAAGPIVEAAGPGERTALVNIATSGRRGVRRPHHRGRRTSRISCCFARRAEVGDRRPMLGVSRARLIEQMTVESLVLALSAGAIAVLFALWGVVPALRHPYSPMCIGPTRARLPSTRSSPSPGPPSRSRSSPDSRPPRTRCAPSCRRR